MQRSALNQAGGRGIVAAAIFTFLMVGLAQGQGLEMVSVSPNTVQAGDSSMSVTATLGTQGLPPDQVQPTAMAVGTLAGASLTRNGADVTGVFSFPVDFAADSYDVSVTFPSPQGDLVATLAGGFTVENGDEPVTGDTDYTIVDTNQVTCYDSAGNAISAPGQGEAYYGQDAQHHGPQPSHTVSADGLTVLDNRTGLTWVKDPDLNGDGTIDVNDKLDQAEAMDYPDTLNAISYGGYNDWRLPSIKELFSLMDFSGSTGMDAASSVAYLDTSVFDFAFGDEGAGERFIDSQWATTSIYVSTVMGGDQAMFGVNFADGRIKGYPTSKLFYVRCVRGNTAYGANDFVDNGEGTVTDRATGLMWTRGDSGAGMNWEQALAYIEQLNQMNYLGHDDWRLPNVKELQSLVDYTRSPDTTGSAAIDPIFECTVIVNEGGVTDYPFYWSGTTHVEGPNGDHACYVSFGRALGWMEQPPGSGNYTLMDVHGAGAQRSDPKTGDAADYPYGFGPQGDVIRIENYVRAVRDAGTSEAVNAAGVAWAMYR